MSVYTHVGASELRRFMSRYALGELVDYGGIAEGIENTNYRVETSRGRYVLTLFEQTAADDLPFCIGLMATLAERGIPSAKPVADEGGRYLQTLADKPALLVEHLSGASVVHPSAAQCHALGDALGRMHTITAAYPETRENERGARWHAETAAAVRAGLVPADRDLLERALEAFAGFDMTTLPGGVIHADLFRDNALFVGERLTGLIDFYYAHSGALIYDLAVVIGDWCFEPDHGFSAERARPLIDAYAAQRPPIAREREAWLAALAAVGLRFWLSRLYDAQFPRGGVMTQTKDPAVFRALLAAVESNPEAALALWT